MTFITIQRAAVALLFTAALGACHDDGAGGGDFSEQAQKDSGSAGAGSANGSSIGQTPGYGAPGTGGAATDTIGGGTADTASPGATAGVADAAGTAGTGGTRRASPSPGATPTSTDTLTTKRPPQR